MKLSIKSLH